jgi:acyl-CoA thioester hydrolase
VSAEPFCFLHRVAYTDCTVGNHVYYSRFLDILERARGEYFRSLGMTFAQWQEQGVIFPVVECRLKYRGPARYDETLRVEVSIAKAEGARLNFGCRVLNAEGKLLVEGETWHVCTGLDDKPRRLPDELARLHPTPPTPSSDKIPAL